MKVAIMQPYFLPYIGYWQLMSYVDAFVIYDDIEYTKKSWINRNRYLLNDKAETFTLSLKKDSDYLDVCKRQLSDSFDEDKEKIIRRLESAYRRAPFFIEGSAILADIFGSEERNLFRFIYQSIELIHARLGMTSKLIISSTLGISKQLKAQERVIATCKSLGAADYINPIGGLNLYDKSEFGSAGINLHFQKVRAINYSQFIASFIPNLSIIDMIMFCGAEKIRDEFMGMDLC